MTILSLLLKTFLCFYALWLLFVCVMHLKKVRESKRRTASLFGREFEIGGLSGPSAFLGLPALAIGWLIDAFCNLILLTIMLCESPRKGEWTVTARLKRHARGPDGRRKRFAVWVGSNFTDDFDPHHILPKPDLNQPAQ